MQVIYYPKADIYTSYRRKEGRGVCGFGAPSKRTQEKIASSSPLVATTLEGEERRRCRWL